MQPCGSPVYPQKKEVRCSEATRLELTGAKLSNETPGVLKNKNAIDRLVSETQESLNLHKKSGMVQSSNSPEIKHRLENVLHFIKQAKICAAKAESGKDQEVNYRKSMINFERAGTAFSILSENYAGVDREKARHYLKSEIDMYDSAVENINKAISKISHLPTVERIKEKHLDYLNSKKTEVLAQYNACKTN